MSDIDFLERHARLKYQINKDNNFNYTLLSDQTQVTFDEVKETFNEDIPLVTKTYEYLIETQFGSTRKRTTLDN